MSSECATESVKPMWVSVGFGILMFIMMMITLIYSLKNLKEIPTSSQTKAQKNKIKTSSETKAHKNKSNESVSATSNTLNAGKERVETNKVNTGNMTANIKEEEEEKKEEEKYADNKLDGDSSEMVITSNAAKSCNTDKGMDNDKNGDKKEAASKGEEEEKDGIATTDGDKAGVLLDGGDITISIQLKLDKTAKRNESETGTQIDDIHESENQYKSEWDKASGCIAKLKLMAKDVWRRKSTYFPMVTHLSDTATDFASVLEFSIVATHSHPKQCGINVWYLVALSIGAMVLYRSISSFKIYQLTESWRRACFQWMDIEIFRVLYISHLYGLKGTSSPQRMLSVLEAVFEAAPQSVIQMVFLMFTRNQSPVVITSAIFSFFNLTLAVIGDDAKMFGIEAATDRLQFVLLYLYRFMDIPSKILGFVFLWYLVSGPVCSLFVTIDIVIAVLLYWKTKNTDALLTVVATPFSFGNYNDDKSWLFLYCCWGIIESVSMNAVIWTLSMDRNIFDTEPAFITVLWMFCSICIVLKWCVGLLLICIVNGSGDESKERSDLDALVENEKFEDVMELIVFKSSNLSEAAKRLYGEGRKYSLWGIAAKCKNERIVAAVQNEGFDNKFKDEGLFETELMREVQDGNREKVEAILNSTDTDWIYILTHDHSHNTALEYVGNNNDLRELLWDKMMTSCGDRRTVKWLGDQYSFLALCLRYRYGKYFEMALKQHGLDNFGDVKVEYITALMQAVENENMEYIEKISNAPYINGQYIKKEDHHGGALYRAIRGGNVELVKCTLNCIWRVCSNDIERADILNNTWAGGKETALHIACYGVKGIASSFTIFVEIYNFYPSKLRKDALLKKNKEGRTALDYLLDINKNKEIEQFILKEMGE